MNTYVNSLITVMVVCQIATVLAPDAEHAKRYIRVVCSLVVLLTLLVPVRSLIVVSGDLTETITSFFTAGPAQMPSYSETEAGAAGLMRYIIDRYDVDELSVVILTDETDTEITEIQLYIKNCPYTKCVTIEADLGEQLDLPVYVYGDT